MRLATLLDRPPVAWPALYIAPIAFFTNLFITYPLVPAVCGNQKHALLHVTEAVFLVIALAGVWYAVRLWRVRRAPGKSDAGDHNAQQHFLGIVGTFTSLLFALAILAQWFTAFVVPPCVS